MSTNEQDTKKSTEVMPSAPAGSLLSFDEFDGFFDDFLSRRWPRLMDWNFPAGFERGFPKVDIIDHDNEIEVQAALPGIKKVNDEVNSDSEESGNTIYLPDRDAKVAELAYYKAESRGFEGGHELEDWLEAEREVVL